MLEGKAMIRVLALARSAAKRFLDILISALVLTISLPLMIIISLLIKLSSPGPIIFRQERIGWQGRKFTIYKFRTMTISANPYDFKPRAADDCRITSVGKILRNTFLDEIPQFFNVLTGDMSIVGPRPEMGFIVSQYNDIERQRLSVKPGITGIWQIYADRTKQIHENIDYDIYYIDNFSLALDLIIMLKTGWLIVRSLGRIVSKVSVLRQQTNEKASVVARTEPADPAR